MFKPQDHYFKKAKQEGFKARSAFKLEEIDEKYKLFDNYTRTILDIGCAPGSWLQFAHKQLVEKRVPNFKVIGFDLKAVNLNLDGVHTYEQDITDLVKIDEILNSHNITKFDMIISDMAPNTIGLKDIDAIRSIGLLEKTLPIYEKFLKPDGKFCIKIFMGPGFDQFVATLKKMYGGKGMKIFKPQATRKASKETYIIRY
ncbi:MAG: RlmE family RNA methyltransferase [Candidatus Absconditabacteria bacterium]